VKAFQLDEALELVVHQFAASVTYPFKKPPQKRKTRGEDPQPGPSGRDGAGRKRKKSSGISPPKDDVKNRKFDTKNMPKNLQVLLKKRLEQEPFFSGNSELCSECLKLIGNSLAKRTWNKYSSALSIWYRFSHGKDLKTFSHFEFTVWCSKYANIKPSTVKEYISAIEKMLSLLGVDSKLGGKTLEKTLLRGMENIQNKFQKSAKKVTPVTLETLEKIKKGLETEICSSCSKKSIWALSLAAFWGLLRLGEILPGNAKTFDKTTTLLWEDVDIQDDKVVFRLKSPKTRTSISKEVVLYKLSESFFCPVTNLKKLERALKNRGLWGKHLPVFLRSSGKSLTKVSFLKALNLILNATGKNKCQMQGKSFRSGIPSIVDQSIENAEKKVLKTLGRWKGPSYHCYIRNPVPENRWIYDRISSMLLTDFLSRKEDEEETSGSG